MDSDEARQHLAMVDAILQRNDRHARPAALAYIAWGTTGAAYYAAYIPGMPEPAAFALSYAGLGLTAIAMIATAWTFRIGLKDRETSSDRQALAALFGITLMMIVLKSVWNTGGLVNGTAFALIWNFGFAVSLTLLGAAGQRVLLAGGIVLFAGMFIGSFFPDYFSLSLAAASLLGIAGPGVYFALRRNDG